MFPGDMQREKMHFGIFAHQYEMKHESKELYLFSDLFYCFAIASFPY